MKKKINLRIWAALCVLIGGIILTWITYNSTSLYHHEDIAVIQKNNFSDTLSHNTKDIYQNHDQVRLQKFDIKVLSGKNSGKVYRLTNTYSPSQLLTQKYRPNDHLLIKFIRHRSTISTIKRDWILVALGTLTLCSIILIAGKHVWALLVSMTISWGIFFALISLDIQTHSFHNILLYGAGTIILSFLALLIVQGFNKKMLVTWLSTLIGLFTSFFLCYLVMKLTGNSQMMYDNSDFSNQDLQGVFLAQTLLSVLGAVLDESTDIVSSLSELIIHNPTITQKEILKSGQALGKEIMGPLINVLLLIFIASELPLLILYLRDNSNIVDSFNYSLTLGLTQTMVAAIGIVLTVASATGCSLLFFKKEDKK
ncbi:YibE/F family protein [Lactobacillus sp. PV037]|uniref:YibE/F family protein n=1 Tax=Lactobacillus sp. PV037 TaxID=2594496 RepID=UPI003A1025DA